MKNITFLLFSNDSLTTQNQYYLHINQQVNTQKPLYKHRENSKNSSNKTIILHY